MDIINKKLFLLIIIFAASCNGSERTEQEEQKDTIVQDRDNEDTTPDGKEEEVDTTNWQSYKSNEYNISFKYPQDWRVVEQNGPFRIISTYSIENEGKFDLPFKIHEDAGVSYLSVFPGGYGTEMPAGKSLSYAEWEGNLSLEFDIAENRSTVFLLENGDPWAFLIRPEASPEGWSEPGFIFTQIKANNIEVTCYDRDTGEQKDMKNCEPLMGDDVKRRGDISKKDCEIIRSIIASTYFFDEKEQRRPIEDLIQIKEPEANDTISSPLTIKGEARGYWYFEASFPVELVDSNNNTLATGIAQADGEWMTEDFVPFSITLEFDSPDDERGYLIFRRSNASGMPEHDRSFRLPVNFKDQ